MKGRKRGEFVDIRDSSKYLIEYWYMEKNNNNNVTLGIWTLYVFIRDTKGRVFGKNYQKVLLKKVKCLTNTYKSSRLRCKLPKRIRYI